MGKPIGREEEKKGKVSYTYISIVFKRLFLSFIDSVGQFKYMLVHTARYHTLSILIHLTHTNTSNTYKYIHTRTNKSIRAQISPYAQKYIHTHTNIINHHLSILAWPATIMFLTVFVAKPRLQLTADSWLLLITSTGSCLRYAMQ